jgi:O-antigen ligase
LNAVGVGSVVFPQLGEIVARLPIDSTFTGRSDVWAFAVLKAETRPIAGYGFDTFWNNSAMRFDAENGWLKDVAHAHNGYLDAALSMGAIGLALTVWALVAQPLADLALARRRGADPVLTSLFARIWLYGLYASSLETFLFDRANPVWFAFLFAVFGLRYVAAFGTSAA